jgi:3-methyladenine DNA glycosylase AlkD
MASGGAWGWARVKEWGSAWGWGSGSPSAGERLRYHTPQGTRPIPARQRPGIDVGSKADPPSSVRRERRGDIGHLRPSAPLPLNDTRAMGTPPESPLLLQLRAELARVADPEKAPGMQAYMKSAMPYHGVQSPTLRAVARALFADLPLPSLDIWRGHVLELWRGAAFREERYTALILAHDRRARAFQTPELLPLHEELVVTGAWWDYVDEVASHLIGPILLNHPAEMAPAMRSWSQSDDLWKRRASIISQLRFKSQTDLQLLYECIGPSIGSREFFLRKAIGWALREYAKTDPEAVRRYVEENQALSGLSRREALRQIERR